MNTHYDAIIIGAGQAGPSMAGRLSSAGMTVALMERHLFGGTCVNTGCMPTKSLVASARVAHQARRARDYGIAIDGSIAIDLRAVKSRKDHIVSTARKGVESWLREHGAMPRYPGPCTIPFLARRANRQ